MARRTWQIDGVKGTPGISAEAYALLHRSLEIRGRSSESHAAYKRHLAKARERGLGTMEATAYAVGMLNGIADPPMPGAEGIDGAV